MADPNYLARIYSSRGVYLGTGTLVAAKHVLTCHHCVDSEAGQQVQVKMPGLDCEGTVLAKVDLGSDLALIELTAYAKAEPRKWSASDATKREVWIHAYPRDPDTTAAKPLHSTSGTVSSVTRENGQPVRLNLPVPADLGMSGGAVVLHVDDELCCVGMITGDADHGSVHRGGGPIARFLRTHGVALPGWPDEPAPPPDPVLMDAEWRKRMLAEFAHLDVRVKLKVQNKALAPLPIDEAYVPLLGRALGAEKDRPLEEFLAGRRLVVLRGDPGSGKSTFLRKAAHDAAGRATGVPMFVTVPALAQHIKACLRRDEKGCPTTELDIRWIADWFASRDGDPPPPREYFLRKLDDPESVLLLDGLDEAPDEAGRAAMGKFLEHCAGRVKCRIVVTARPHAADHAPTVFERVHVQPLDEEGVAGFRSLWARALYPNDADEAERFQQAVAEALEDKPEIAEIARNPFMLTAVAVIYWNQQRLPKDRAHLYEGILGWLLSARDATRRTKAEECHERLKLLAFQMQDAGGKRVESLALSDAATAIVTAKLEHAEARRFLVEEVADSGIVVEKGDGIGFAHLTFQEYLAARYVFECEDPWRELTEDRRLDRPEWLEVVRLLAGTMEPRPRQRLFERILAERVDGTLEERARCLVLVAEVLRDVRPFEIEAEAWRRLIGSIARDLFTASAENDALDVRLRAAAGDALGEVGDPRLLTPDDPDYWAVFEGGRVLLGATRAEDPEAERDEAPREADLRRFWLGKRLVTVFEYERFLAANPGEREPLWWKEQSRIPNRPVVGVTWAQASEYCRWAGGRLPLAEEWEFAARGTERRKYPWGNAPVPGPLRANFARSVDHPTAVGLFPRGNTEAGLTDLAGNVWEWTASDLRGGKELRGGSYHLVARGLRASCRDDYHPDARLDVIGFRCARE